MRAVGGSCAEGNVGNGLDADVGGVEFSASMLDEDLDGRLPAKAFLRVGTIPADGAVESYGKGLLMGVEVEDVALPVYPHVEVQTGTFPQELESHFRIGGEILFGIVKRENELVVLCAVDVAEDEGEVAEVGLCAEPGENVNATLILVSLPPGHIVEGIVGIAIGAIEEEEMGSCLELDLWMWRIDEFRLKPRARQGVAFGEVAAVFVVVEEGEGVDLSMQLPCARGVDAKGVGANNIPDIGASRGGMKNEK